MKSALDLALERSGGALHQLDGKQKAVIAEIEKKYKARLAEVELATEARLLAAAAAIDDPSRLERVRAELTAEVASLRERCERDKVAARK